MLDGWLAFAQAENSEGLHVHKGGKLLPGWGETGLRTLSQESWPNFCPNSLFSRPLLYLRPNSQSKDKGRHENKRFQLQLLVSEGHLLLGVQGVLLMFCRKRLSEFSWFHFYYKIHMYIKKYTCMKFTISIIIAILQLRVFLIPRYLKVPVPWQTLQTALYRESLRVLQNVWGCPAVSFSTRLERVTINTGTFTPQICLAYYKGGGGSV